MSLKRLNRNRKQSLCAINSSRALYTSTRRPLADIETSTNYSFGIMLMTWPGACRLMVSGLRWWGNMIFRSVYKYKQPSDPGEGVYCSFLLCRLDLLAWPSYKRRGQIQEQSAIWSTWCRPGFELRGADLNLTHNRKWTIPMEGVYKIWFFHS